MEGTPISSRQRQLLGILNGKHTVTPGRELAEELGVSPRTIRQLVSELGAILDGDVVRIRSIASKGYLLDVADRKRFHELISEHGHFRTREDRIAYLIRVLLESDEWIALSDLEERMFVSRTTLESDLKEVRRQIVENEPYIGLERRHSALLFERDERKRRDILIRLYLERWDFNSREGVAFFRSILDAEVLEGIRRALKTMLSASGIRLDDYGHIYLLLSTAVIYERNLLGHPLLSFPRAAAEETEAAVRDYLDGLRREWEIELAEADYHYLAAAADRLRWLGFGGTRPELMGERKRPRGNGRGGSGAEESCPAPERSGEADGSCPPSGGGGLEARACAIAKALAEELKERYGFAFDRDERFMAALCRASVSFLLPQLSTLPQSTYEYERLAKNYPYLTEAAEGICRSLAGKAGYSLRDGEALYLLPLLAAAAERQERAGRLKLKVVVVSHYSDGLTEYLCENLRKLFGNRIAVVGAVPVYDRQRIEDYAPALIVTTVQAETFRNYRVPAVVTTASVTEEDLLRIDAAIQRAERKLLKGDAHGARQSGSGRL